MWQQAPSTTTSHDVEDSVKDLAHRSKEFSRYRKQLCPLTKRSNKK
jgi:hypothetical protein